MSEAYSESFRTETRPARWEEVHAGVTIEYTTEGVVFRGGEEGGPRSYLRTRESDVHLCPLVAVVAATATSTYPVAGAGIAFFGLGVAEPTPGHWNEPRETPHVYCRAVPTRQADASFSVTGDGTENPAPYILEAAGDGTHDLWLIWDPGSGGAGHAVATVYGLGIARRMSPTAIFAISPAAPPGERRLDEATRLDPVDCSDYGFDSSNSKLFIGGAGGVTFRDLEVKVFDWRPVG